MAKDSDKTAGTLKAKKTGSALSGLLAEENEFDRRTLWRIGWWGTAAVAAVMVAVFANQAALGWRRDRISASDLSRQAQLLQSLARETQGETRQLASAVETLNTDRDRLYARVTVLEQGLDSVTGALAKQNSPPAAASAGIMGKAWSPTPAPTSAADAPTPSPTSSGSAAASMPPSPAAASGSAPPAAGTAPAAVASQSGPNPAATGSSASPPLPAVSPVATTTAADRTHPEPPRPSPTPATASATQTPTMFGPPPPSAAPAATSLVASRSMMAPPDPAASKLSEPDKRAKAEFANAELPKTELPRAELSRTDPPKTELPKADLPKAETGPQSDAAGRKSADAAEAASTSVERTEFAVDLGGANSLGGLRALWRGLSKTHAELAALHPIIILKEGNGGLGMQLRLGAGPLNDAAAAAKICARLAESRRPCETTVYDGQQLAVRRDETETPDATRKSTREAAKETAKEKETARQPAPGAMPATAGQPAAAQQQPPKPQPQRRRAFQQQRHGAREEPPAPPAPPPPEQPSTLSSLFHRE
jgi:hypothetical protein